MSARYVPAAGRDRLLRAYDPVLALTMRERRWRDAVVEAAGGPLVVDVGAGTGAQALRLARSAEVVAVDGDPSALAIAQRKPGGDSIEWRLGLADALPVETATADAVVMTLLLQHLDRTGKEAALKEARRVLREGGRLVVADWGAPSGPLPRLGARALRAIDGAEGLDDGLAGRLPRLIASSGFTPPHALLRVPTLWGTLELLVSQPR